MEIGIFNPYHDSFGGGEKYIFSIASYFLQTGHSVQYFSDNAKEVKESCIRFNLNLSDLNIVPCVFEKGTLLQKIKKTNTLDMLFFYSDGSLPLSFAKKTYIVFQFPVPWVVGTSIINRLKLLSVHGIFVNSEFTKKSIDRTFTVNSAVLYPPIVIKEYKSQKKENVILTVGRFTKGMNVKKHDILIEAFKIFQKKVKKNWKLVIVGGMNKDDWDLVTDLQRQTEGFSIQIKPNIERKELLELYSKSSFYWHAAGYGVNIQNHPEQTEHFGISIVEAMASGTIPFVYNEGGPAEIVNNEVNGIFWKKTEELVEKTLYLIASPKKQELLQNQARLRAKEFDISIFDSRLKYLLSLPQRSVK